jgi:hypothetical protein
MKKINLSFILLILLAGIFNACEDKFSEKDALEAQQTINLSVYVYDGYDQSGISGASVTVIKDGDNKIEETNDLGVALFKDVKIGGNIPVKVEKDGYTPVQTMADIDVDNYRQGNYTIDLPMLSLDSNTATIKGRLTIQTDLTNDSLEVPPEGSTIKGYVDMGGYIQPVELVTSSDADGKFEFIVPTTNQGIDFDIKYPTLTLDQKIAKNRNEGQPPFPETLPSIVTINTVFNPTGTSEDVPYVDPVYATVPAPSGDGERAVISNVDVNSLGEVYDIDFSNTGSGYTADSVDVTITSLFEGSGAQIRVGVTGGSLYEGNVNVLDVGSGYPSFPYANRTNKVNPFFNANIDDLKTGEIRTAEGNYGTGTYRETEIK